MDAITLIPDPHLMESMRAVGYNLETAIADLVDNSITAGADRVDILFSAETDPYVAIVDNGSGMSALEAQNAMRLAGNSSRDARTANDLGRFGLGLKTASISQCRDLVLVTKKDGQIHGYRWDLDYLIETQSWSLIQLSKEECDALPEAEHLHGHSSGTMVLWRKLDQMEATLGDLTAGLDTNMVRVSRHLGLVFHRYLAGEHGRTFEIAINYRAIEGADPLLQNHKATQAGPLEKIYIEGEMIELRPYTLPHLNRLKPADKKKAQVEGTLRDSQGFYIYREKRLVIWGTWFRIAPKQELGKLARVRVDVPNSLDHLWALDIKKAQAVPPPAIRNRLRQVADSIVAPSRRVHEYRGRQTVSGGIHHLWDVVDDRNAFRYEINRGHPAIVALSEHIDGDGSQVLNTLLGLLEQSFPVEDVYNRLGQDAEHKPAKVVEDEVVGLAASIWSSLKGSLSPDDFVAAMLRTEPFTDHPSAEIILKNAVMSNV
ncbi:ATP-binding protein [Arthrobacter sp. MAHUQ-56]